MIIAQGLEKLCFFCFKEKESLEELLLKSEENLEESKAYINQLRSQQRDEKRERARYHFDYCYDC